MVRRRSTSGNSSNDRRRRPSALFASALLCCALAEPVSMKLGPKEKRCLWSELSEGGVVSVFVLSGGKLKVGLDVKGPYKVDTEHSPVLWDESVPTVFDGVVSSAEIADDDDDAFAKPTNTDISGPTGAYRACVTNTFSRFDDLVVTLDWHVTKSAKQDDDDLVSAASSVSATTQDTADKGEQPLIPELARQVVALRADLAQLQQKQRRERRRLAHHKTVNDASHNAIVESSLLETAVYILVSLFQIIFVRRWFDGKGIGAAAVFGSDNV